MTADTEPCRLTATDAARRLAEGSLTSEALVSSCLERIAEREATVRAFAHLDRELALPEARACDRRGRPGPLHGLPVGIKDIIDTADRPTGYGSPIYDGHRPAHDARCVIRTRARGGVVLGKTATTEFAWSFPGPTRNPHHPAHTPGGSSSGSAAAVADYMVPLAFGTQTGGSVIRPSAYCGIVGFKPTYNRYPMAGIKPLSPGLDTLGLHARTVEDAALFDAALTGAAPLDSAAAAGSLRIGLCETPAWSKAEPAVRNALHRAADVLSRRGMRIELLDLPDAFAGLLEAAPLIMRTDGAVSLATEYRDHRDRMSEFARRSVTAGAATDAAALSAAWALVESCTAAFDVLARDHDAILTPSAPGEAPASLESTGDAAFNRLWTALHAPCLTLPAGTGPAGLPIGIQLVGRRYDDRHLLAVAQRVESVLRDGGV